MYVYEKKLSPGVCLPQPRGYIHVYFHNIQISSALKVFGQSKQNFMCSILRKLEGMFFSNLGHMTKMATMPIYGKNL